MSEGQLCSKCDEVRMPDSFFCQKHHDRLPRSMRNQLDNSFRRHLKKGNARSKGNLVRAISTACQYLAQFPDEKPRRPAWWRRLLATPARVWDWFTDLAGW